MNDPPQLLNRGRNIPSGVDRIVHHCLEKQPARRFQSAADVALALEAITLNDESAAPSTRASSGRTTWAKPVGLLATAAAGALLGAGAIWLTDRPPTSPSSDRVLLTDAARLTLGVGFSDWPSWSPDGKLFAFSSNRTGNFEIYIRRVEGGQEVNTTNDPADDVQPAISPDGTSIAFVSTRSSRTPLVRMRATATGDYRTYGGDLWVAPVLGGQPRRLAENANFPAWRPDGRAIAYVTGMESHRAIVEAPVDGGTPKDLLAASSSTWEIVRIRYAPQGGLTFETTDRKVLALPSCGGPPTSCWSDRVTPGPRMAVSSTSTRKPVAGLGSARQRLRRNRGSSVSCLLLWPWCSDCSATSPCRRTAATSSRPRCRNRSM